MHVKAKLASYEKLQYSVTLTSPVEHWRLALKQIDQTRNKAGYIEWPLSYLYEAIEKMLRDLDETHAAILEDTPSLRQEEK